MEDGGKSRIWVQVLPVLLLSSPLEDPWADGLTARVRLHQGTGLEGALSDSGGEAGIQDAGNS